MTGYSRTSSYDQPRSLPLPVNADIELHKTGPDPGPLVPWSPGPLVPWSPVIPVEVVPCVAGGDIPQRERPRDPVGPAHDD